MATVSFRVPEEMKDRMEERDEIDWSAVLRRHVESKLDELEARDVSHAVATSERLSREIDETEVSDENTAELVRTFRDER